MHEGIVIRLAETMWDALAMRRARNSCREFMTRDTSRKTIVGQLWWWYFARSPCLDPFVIEIDGRIVGYAILSREGRRGWVTAGLLPKARGRGAGTEVFRHLTEMAERDSLLPSLEVRESNDPAIAVYKKLGYKMRSTDGVIMEMVKR